MASFMDYYQAELQKQTARTPSAAAAPPRKLASGDKSVIDQVLSPTNPIGWTLDMISRPLYGVEKKLGTVIDEAGAAAQKLTGVQKTGDNSFTVGKADPLGGALDVAKTVLGLSPAQAAAQYEGMTGNKQTDKVTTSHNIEHLVDTANNLTPGYQNVDDNVNPWVKGIGGFVGDVALDPLNLVPPAAIAKFGGSAAKLLKGAYAGAKDAVTPAAKTVESAVKTTEAVPAPARVTPEQVAAENVNPMEFGPKNTGLDTPTPKPVAPSAGLKPASPGSEPGILPLDNKGAAKLPDPAKVSEQAAKIDHASEAVVKVATKQQTLSEALKSSPKIPGMKAEVQAIFDATKAGPSDPVKINDFVNSTKQEIYTSLPGDSVAKAYPVKQLAQIAIAAKKDLPLRAQAARDLVIKAHADNVAAQATAVTDHLAAFQSRMQGGEKVIRSVLGNQLVDHLASITSPKHMQTALETLNHVLAGAVDPASTALTSDASKIMDSLRGFLPETVKPAAAANVPGEAQRVAHELTASSEVFRKIVRQEMLPGTPEYAAKYHPPTGKNPLTFTIDETNGRLARWWRKGNQQFQFTVFGELSDSVLKASILAAKGKPLEKLFGAQNAAAFRDAISASGADITRAMETFGIPVHIGTKENLLPITFPQVYDAVNKSLVTHFGDDAALLGLYNGGSRVAFTNLMEAVHRMLNGGDLQAVRDAIRLPVKNSNNIIKNGANGWYRVSKKVTPEMKAQADAVGGAWVPNATAGKQGFQLKLNGAKLPDMVAEAIWNAKDELAATVAANRTAWAARGISEAQDITGSVLSNLRRLTGDPSKAAQREAAIQIRDASKNVADEAARIGATGEATIAADTMVHATIGETTAKQAEALTTHESDLKADVPMDEAAAKANDKLAASVENAPPGSFDSSEVSKLMEEAHAEAAKTAVGSAAKVKIPEYEIGADHATQVYDTVESFLPQANGLFRRFQSAFGAKTLTNDVQAAGTTASKFVAEGIVGPMNALTRKFSAPVLKQALQAVLQGTRVADGELAAAAQGMSDIVNRLVDLTPGAKGFGMGNALLDNATNIGHVNEMLKWAHRGTGQPLQFDLGKAIEDAKLIHSTKKPKQSQIAEQLREQVRTWNFGEDAAAAINGLGMAAGRVAEHQAIVTNLVRVGQKQGWALKLAAGQKAPAGYVKIVDSHGGTLARLLPKNVVVQEAIAKEMKVINWVMTEPRQLSGELGDLVRSTIVPITNSWKRLMTVMRLGHHIRNGIGNLTLQYVARGTRDMGRSWEGTLKVMGVRNDYHGMDALAALRDMGSDVVPKGGDVLVNGKFGPIDQAEIWDRLNREGLLPTYKSAEGLSSGGDIKEGVISKAASFVSLEKTRLGDAAALVSKNLDHYQRVHHFMQILMQESSKKGGRFTVKNKEDLFKQAAREVKRSHPDSSTLSAFENSTMKLIIPFYTWLRGVLPFAIESALQNPARVNAFNKASYNLAVGAGVNPDSLSDPFPADQLFPSYIKESMFGPQFQFGDKYVRVNPGVAHADLMSTLMANDPVRAIAGMTNPLFRVPAELLSGGSWQTGAPIKDVSDYLDQSLPGINYAANISGISPTGSVGSLLAGQGLDPQKQVAKGNKDGFDQALTVANWITGLGFQNLTRPNYINAAEIEKRNAAAKGQTSGK